MVKIDGPRKFIDFFESIELPIVELRCQQTPNLAIYKIHDQDEIMDLADDTKSLSDVDMSKFSWCIEIRGGMVVIGPNELIKTVDEFNVKCSSLFQFYLKEVVENENT